MAATSSLVSMRFKLTQAGTSTHPRSLPFALIQTVKGEAVLPESHHQAREREKEKPI